MQSVAAAVTMVRDDAFFLAAWLRYYGGLLGRENCYVINHGRGELVSEMAAGCNVIGLPGDPDPKFDVKRWRLLNGLVAGLRAYYRQVIVGDVDELVVLDPEAGGLLDWLAAQPLRRVLTPLGLEIVHHVALEPEALTDRILGPRRHLRLAPHYSKPCVISRGTKLARGGHFSQCPTLVTPDPLYLFHLKYCDFGLYAETMDRRNAQAAASGATASRAAIGRHWFAAARGEDRALFDSFAALDLREGFDLGWVRRQMHRSWQPRGDSGYWQFDRPDYELRYRLPERFIGLF